MSRILKFGFFRIFIDPIYFFSLFFIMTVFFAHYRNFGDYKKGEGLKVTTEKWGNRFPLS